MTTRVELCIGLLAAAIALAALDGTPASPPQDADSISLAEAIMRVDRRAIIDNTDSSRIVTCTHGDHTHQVRQFVNPWPYAVVESAPEPGGEWVSVTEYAALHHHADLRDSYTYDPGSRHSEQSVRRATTYRFAPLPSHLGLGHDGRIDNWAFPEARDDNRYLAIAHDGDVDVGWQDPALARRLAPTSASRPDAFRRCYDSPDNAQCFGTWGPRDGAHPLTAWMPDATRRCALLRLLYSAELSRGGAMSAGRTWQDLGLTPAAGPETDHFIQLIFPEREDATRIGERAVARERQRRDDRIAAILMGWFRRPAYDGAPCESVLFLEEAPR